MHLLFLIANYPGFGGIERVTQVLANGLVAEGHRATIVSLCPTHQGATTADLDARVTHLPLPNTAHIASAENVACLVHALRHEAVDAVIYQDGYVPDLLPLVQAVQAQEPFCLLVAEHNTPLCHVRSWSEVVRGLDWRQPKDWLRALAWPLIRAKRWPQVVARHRALLQCAYRYVVLSEAYIPHLKQLVGQADEEKMTHQGNPLTIAPPTDKMGVLTQKQKECLVVSRLERDKGIDLLMRIWPRFAQAHPEWTLTILGTGRMEQTLRTAIATGQMPRTTLATPTHDVAPYYARATALLLTSRFEGWPLVLTEAMAYGCVPIAFESFAALPYMYRHGAEGYIVPAFDVVAFVEAMCQVATHPNLLHLQRQAIARAEEAKVSVSVAEWLARVSLASEHRE